MSLVFGDKVIMLDLSKWHKSNRYGFLTHRQKWHSLNRNAWHYETEITGTNRTEVTSGYLRIKQPFAKARYIAYCLDKEGQQIGFSRTKRASIDRIEGIKIPLPTIAEQEKVDIEIEKLEKEITEFEKQIAEIPKQKEAILKKYLE
ncbi:hypothetical protein M8845_18225 [Gelidibacter japonicus]|uniref:hypothetical protein n=1 Tax=Gelidibacter japonicus TaxID=1962232 RepID=UPI002020B7DA|nr:hypothetical protein [Gelidibacter japonicus]MCL8009367.1 hypothetical protein [Gelidibacter japonicus]